jgi:hypothetical protein
MTRWLPMLALALAWQQLIWPLPASAEPDSQVAFRAVLVKYDGAAETETDIDRLQALEAQRGLELAEALGKGLRFEGWQLVISASETTPMGGIFLRLLDPQLLSFKTVRPTYWNSGPGAILRQVEIAPGSPLHASVALLKREAQVVVSGRFFPSEQGGPLFEAASSSFQSLTNRRARFRMPYFSIAIEAIDELFSERRFP